MLPPFWLVHIEAQTLSFWALCDSNVLLYVAFAKIAMISCMNRSISWVLPWNFVGHSKSLLSWFACCCLLHCIILLHLIRSRIIFLSFHFFSKFLLLVVLSCYSCFLSVEMPIDFISILSPWSKIPPVRHNRWTRWCLVHGKEGSRKKRMHSPIVVVCQRDSTHWQKLTMFHVVLHLGTLLPLLRIVLLCFFPPESHRFQNLSVCAPICTSQNGSNMFGRTEMITFSKPTKLRGLMVHGSDFQLFSFSFSLGCSSLSFLLSFHWFLLLLVCLFACRLHWVA